MSEAPTAASERPQVPPYDPIVAVIEPALRVGVACGGAGFLFGGAAGIVKGTAPLLFATASSIQTFALGTTYWGCRSAILQAWTPTHRTPSDLVKASAISGGVTGGAIALITRGRANAIPGAIMFSLFGGLGQMAVNRLSARPAAITEPKQGFWRRMSEKSFSPVSILTNEEYAEMLREKMLKVDVEIAIIDDKIAALKDQAQRETEQTANSTTTAVE